MYEGHSKYFSIMLRIVTRASLNHKIISDDCRKSDTRAFVLFFFRRLSVRDFMTQQQ